MDKIVINVSGQTDLDSTIKKLVELGVVDEKNAKAFLANSKSTQKEIEKTGTAYSGLKDSVTGYLQALPGAQHVQQIANLGKSINVTSAATGGASKAMQVFRVSMLAVPIIAFVAAIASLVSYFKKTDEGAAKLSGIMGGLGAVVNIVTGYLAKFGEWLFTAASSAANFQTALKDLGDAIVENVINRFKAVLVYGEAIALLFERKWAEAALKATDATIQLTSGITDGTAKMRALGEEMSKAGKEAYDLALAFDALEDAERNHSFAAAQAHKEITNLIIQSKNRTLAEKERLAIIDKASSLETAIVEKSLELAKQRAALIIRENQLLRDNTTISNKAASDQVENILKTGKLLEQKGQLSDDDAQREVDAINKIIQIQEESANLQERLANRRDQIVEAGKAKREAEEKQRQEEEKKRLAEVIKHREDVLKALDSSFLDESNQYRENAGKILQAIGEDYINRRITKEEFEKRTNEAIISIQRDQLNREAELIKQKLDVSGLEYEKKVELEEQLNDVKEKLYKMDLAAFAKSEVEKTKEEKKASDERAKINQIFTEFAIQNIQKIAASQLENSRIKTDNEINSLQVQSDAQIAALQKRNEDGILSDEAFAKQKEAIQKKQAQKELELRRRQAQAEKNAALFQIAINTASAILKAFAQFGPPPSPVGIAAAGAALLTGGIEAAIVSARPLPGFKKGGYTGDGNVNSEAGVVHKKEFVMPAEKTAKYREDLQAMYEGRYSKDYRNPIKLDRSLTDIRGDNMADSIYKSMLINGFNDKNIVNAIGKNNRVKLANGSELANQIATKISDRSGERGLYA